MRRRDSGRVGHRPGRLKVGGTRAPMTLHLPQTYAICGRVWRRPAWPCVIKSSDALRKVVPKLDALLNTHSFSAATPVLACSPGAPARAADILGPLPRWQPVSAEQARGHPHAAIASVRIHIVGAGTTTAFFSGTGWFVAPDRVVTAAHVLDLRRAWASVPGASSWHLEVVPGESSADPQPFGATWAERVERHPRFVDDGVSPWDLAVMKVKPPSGLTTALCIDVQPALAGVGIVLKIAGYAWNGGSPDAQFQHTGQVQAREGAAIFYDIDTEGGQSGSPLLLRMGAAEVAVGVHTGGQGRGQGALARSLNSGIAFDASSVAWLKSV
jgi:V8-like Glu-specific endopeptidase